VAVRLQLALTMVLWGGSFVANHELLRSIDTVQIVAARYFLVAVIFAALLAVRSDLRPRFNRRDWRLIAISAVLAVPLSQMPVVQALHYLSPGLTSFIITLSPAFATVLAFLLLHERVRRLQVAGLVIALGGAAAVILWASGGTDLTVANPAGAALAILTPLSWAGYTIVSKPLAAAHRPLTAVATVLIVGAVLLVPAYPHTASGLPGLSGAQWLWLLYLVGPGTVLPYLVWFASLRSLPAASTAAALYLVPIAGLAWSVAILDEQLTAVGLAGAGLIVAGVALTQFSAPGAVPAPVGVPAATSASSDDRC
jgi:drug/metabolite transporter (DMT)-like permease